MIVNIVLAVLFFLAVGLVICFMFSKAGFFEVYTEVNITQREIYLWHKFEIIEGGSFSFDDSPEDIKLKAQQLKRDALVKIEKIKHLKQKLK